jgi:hypothetical protein
VPIPQAYTDPAINTHQWTIYSLGVIPITITHSVDMHNISRRLFFINQKYTSYDLTLFGDSVADRCPTCHHLGFIQSFHRRGLALLLCPLAQTQTPILRPAQAVHLPYRTEKEPSLSSQFVLHYAVDRFLNSPSSNIVDLIES